jgi:hypothetical protein
LLGDLGDERTGASSFLDPIRAMMSCMDSELRSDEVKQRANRQMRDAAPSLMPE